MNTDSNGDPLPPGRTMDPIVVPVSATSAMMVRRIAYGELLLDTGKMEHRQDEDPKMMVYGGPYEHEGRDWIKFTVSRELSPLNGGIMLPLDEFYRALGQQFVVPLAVAYRNGITNIDPPVGFIFAIKRPTNLSNWLSIKYLGAVEAGDEIFYRFLWLGGKVERMKKSDFIQRVKDQTLFHRDYAMSQGFSLQEPMELFMGP